MSQSINKQTKINQLIIVIKIQKQFKVPTELMPISVRSNLIVHNKFMRGTKLSINKHLIDLKYFYNFY
jgi:hypothetical protein